VNASCSSGDLTAAAQDLKREVDAQLLGAARSPAMEWAARVGFAARGLVYVLVGGLAVLAAAGHGGGATGTRGALRRLLYEPFGRVMLAAAAAGLACYAAWRFVESLADAERLGRTPVALLIRAGLFVGGAITAALALEAARLALMGSGHHRDPTGDRAARDWTATLMAEPLGAWLVAGVGAGFIAACFYQLYKVYRKRVDRGVELDRLSPGAARLIRTVAWLGTAARGAVFFVLGGFLIQAARHHHAGEARGLGGALQSLTDRAFGPWLLGGVALGLVAFGVYQLLLARYRDIGSPGRGKE
jgi:hypothetical protein